MGLDAGPNMCALFRQGLSGATKIMAFIMDLSVSWQSSHSMINAFRKAEERESGSNDRLNVDVK